MGGGAWPFLVGGAICLVNSVNERDLSLLTSYAEVSSAASFLKGLWPLRPRKFEAITGEPAEGSLSKPAWQNDPRTHSDARGWGVSRLLAPTSREADVSRVALRRFRLADPSGRTEHRRELRQGT
ncbi:hypothetical protein ACLB2K_068227 [Fragaria x ananassa]